MGIREFFGFGKALENASIASPWADSSGLAPAIAADIWGSQRPDNLPLTKAECLQVPAVSRVHNLLISTICPLPLRVMGPDGNPVTPQPTWASRTDSDQTPYQRMSGIVADLLFYGVSALAVRRGARGQVLQLAHVPYTRWSIDGRSRILIDGEPVQDGEVIFVDSPYAGLIAVGSPTIKGARDLELAWHARSRSPIPLVVISHQNTDTASGGLEPDEIKTLIAGYTAARRDVNGAVGYLPPGLRIEAFGESEADLFEKGRNAATTSIGQLANVRASMIDGTLADSSSLTYVTATGERSSFLTFDLPFYTRVIEERLSQDDIVSPGQSVSFDFSELLANPPTPTGSQRDD